MIGYAGNICPHCGAGMGDFHRSGCRYYGWRVGDISGTTVSTGAATTKRADMDIRETALRLAREAGLPTYIRSDYHPTGLERLVRAAMAEGLKIGAEVCDAQEREPECPERAAYCAAALRGKAEEISKHER